MAKVPPRRRADFTDILVRKGICSLEQVEETRAMAKSAGLKIEDAMEREGHATGEEIVEAMAEEHRMEYVNLKDVVISREIVELVPESTARENTVMPFAEEGATLKVVVSTPHAIETLDKLRFILNRPVEAILAHREAIVAAINKYYGRVESESMDSMLQEFTDTAIDFTETEEKNSDDVVDENSAPIVRLVQLIITEAVNLRASDIHVEPFEDRIRVRYRIDGVLHERDAAPRRLLGALLSRIKILAKIDIAERRRPQDGRIKVTVGPKELDLRVSVLPTNHGQSVVMRILDKDNIKVGLKQLGFIDDDYNLFRQYIRRPNGIVLVTGPTGSGKTTTLYAALNELNRPDRKIITAEDPVEYYLPGINQVEVRHQIGLNFARIIRSMLRMAPNVILVGEIRDRETAEMAIQASLTGHLVFSTLHTNDAPSAITRLIDIGVPPYLVASSIIAVLAQRLVRVICNDCKQPFMPSAAALEQAHIPQKVAEKAHFMKGRGCGHCQKSGYRGRVALYEIMTVTSKIRELAFKGAATQDIRKLAVQSGMKTLYKDGLIKVVKGVTTLEEVFRVAGKT